MAEKENSNRKRDCWNVDGALVSGLDILPPTNEYNSNDNNDNNTIDKKIGSIIGAGGGGPGNKHGHLAGQDHQQSQGQLP